MTPRECAIQFFLTKFEKAFARGDIERAKNVSAFVAHLERMTDAEFEFEARLV